MKEKSVYSVFLIIILFFSAFIYFYNLNKESLSTDEYFSFYVEQLPVSKIIFAHKETSPNTIPPLYEIIMHFWLKIFGTGEFAQRSFSALMGVASVYVLYRLAYLLFDIQTGLLSALLGSLAFSWFYFFRINRCYGLLIFFTLLSFYVFFYYLKHKDSKLSLPTLTIINILAVYTHYFAFLVILLQMLFSGLEWKNNRKWSGNILIMGVYTFIFYIPWYSNLFYDIQREPVINSKVTYYDSASLFFSMGIALLSDLHIKWNIALPILYLPFILTGIIKSLKKKSEYSKYRLQLLLIMIIPFLIIFFLSNADRERYYVPFLFPLLLFLSFGIISIKSRQIKKFILFPSLICMAIFNFVDFYEFFHNPLNENWKLAVKYIKEVPDYKNKEMVFIFQTKYNPSVFAYYYWGKDMASSFVENMTNYEGYNKKLSQVKSKDKIFLINNMEDDLFKKIDSLPDNAWLWIFRYHYIYFPLYMELQSNGNYFLHQIILNKELPQIDFYLLRKIK